VFSESTYGKAMENELFLCKRAKYIVHWGKGLDVIL
jgi:hypothetical protein